MQTAGKDPVDGKVDFTGNPNDWRLVIGPPYFTCTFSPTSQISDLLYSPQQTFPLYISAMAATEIPRKRKRETDDAEEKQELEIDLTLPEPLSKKAARKAKKAKDTKNDPDAAKPDAAIVTPKVDSADDKNNKRSEWGIWIGNLPWSMGKNDLRGFLCKQSDIDDKHITRVHMPPPKDSKLPSKPKNKGFAYVDFETEENLTSALKLSDTLYQGRRVLIKNAKSFEGRPEKPAATEMPGKPPSKRIFVGNLGYDVSKEDLEKHFGQCGVVENVHVATFEDSGKCKGFAWVTFEELEASTSAVRGWFTKEKDEEGKKPHKWWVKKLEGRPLRCEFAEDATVRYNKRFGKGGKKDQNGEEQEVQERPPRVKYEKPEVPSTPHDRRREKRKAWENQRARDQPATDTKPPKATGAIIEGAGKKISFD